MKYNLALLLTFFTTISIAQLREGFVYAQDIIQDLDVELKYCNDDNFVGEQIDGYNKEVVIMTTLAAKALKNVQDTLKKKGLGLKIYDAYRPQQAVNHFVRWAKQVNDTLKKQEYYPNVDKKNLFSQGYIASKSRHSSGSTVDLTIINLKTGKVLDMGSPYDFFGPESWVSNTKLTSKQQENRQLLQHVMLTNGFRNYPKEWWHFTLKGEPFKNQYFDFPVE
ncbi:MULTISPECIES: M15 family metallopeptidase [unclassified Olleya]|jgi:D-alanyl-D-alanine dipeptidase|uniref:M15 family metallopeptidase n=1 Tax=unclassified Olleya TaxID=2615019 RepID=UPI0011A85B4E|nr:M15 family metallopeptidase [Olleya sp. Hel_I_94]TVZ47224.1 D-alanyl-D-alanine dipeptidase [Olleya sp. Hel_I_94]